jgi:hypothetical protein
MMIFVAERCEQIDAVKKIGASGVDPEAPPTLIGTFSILTWGLKWRSFPKKEHN